MASINGYTAEYIRAILQNTVLDIAVNSAHHLIITKTDGTTIDAGDISATARLGVVDTDTINLTLSGSGTLASPWALKADVGQLTQQALLDPGYNGAGPARVSFLPSGTLSSEYYQWIGKYQKWGNRAVEMIREGSSWRILGHTGHTNYGGKISMEPWLGSNYMPYNVRSSSNEYNDIRVQKLASGIVVLSGLLSSRETGSANELIAVLPPGFRPDNTMIFPVNNYGTTRTVSIRTNGEIRWEGSFASGSGVWVSLDGIAFPAAGVANWTNITEWVNNWKSWSDEYKPAYWKDPYGVVWFKGLVTGGAKGGDAVMFKIPASHVSPFQTHNIASTDQGLGYVSSFPTTQGAGGDRGVTWKSGNPSSATWLSLCGVRIITADAYAAYPWIRNLPTGNQWETTYGEAGRFPTLGVARRPDGLALSTGLVKVGTIEKPIANMQDWILPEKRTILCSVSGDASCRIDIMGLNQGQSDFLVRGQAYGSGTHNVWTSFDGLAWMIGD
jgi:hypothetical protein